MLPQSIDEEAGLVAEIEKNGYGSVQRPGPAYNGRDGRAGPGGPAK